jgi:hypothetical protein
MFAGTLWIKRRNVYSVKKGQMNRISIKYLRPIFS